MNKLESISVDDTDEDIENAKKNIELKPKDSFQSWDEKIQEILSEKYSLLENTKKNDFIKFEIEVRFGKIGKKEEFNPNIEKKTFEELYKWISSDKRFLSIGKDNVIDMNVGKGYRLRKEIEPSYSKIDQLSFVNELKVNQLYQNLIISKHNYDLRLSIDEEMQNVDTNFKHSYQTRYKNREKFIWLPYKVNNQSIRLPYIIEFCHILTCDQNNNRIDSFEIEIEFLTILSYEKVYQYLQSQNLHEEFCPIESFNESLRNNKITFIKGFTKTIMMIMNHIMIIESAMGDKEKKDKGTIYNSDKFHFYNKKQKNIISINDVKMNTGFQKFKPFNNTEYKSSISDEKVIVETTKTPKKRTTEKNPDKPKKIRTSRNKKSGTESIFGDVSENMTKIFNLGKQEIKSHINQEQQRKTIIDNIPTFSFSQQPDIDINSINPFK